MPTHRPIGTITLADGASVAIDLTAYFDKYYVTGTDTLTTNWAVTGSGTLYTGMSITFEYRGTATIGANHVFFMGTQMPDAYAAKKVNVDCYYDGSAWVVDYQPAFDESDIISTAMILDDNITTAKILDANVTLAKLEPLTAAYLIVGNVSNRPTAMALTGAIAITNAGVSSITAGIIVNADINAAAAIALTKLAVLPTTSKALVSTAGGVISEATTSTTEIQYLAGVTPGTSTASKVAILGANKNLDTLVLADGGLYLGSGAGTAVTSTASELNILDGATLNVTELNYLNGSVPGTAVASKVLSLGASKDVDELDVTTTFKIGGVQVTSTAAELNKLDTVTTTAAQLNYLNTATSDVQVQLDAIDGDVETYVAITTNTTWTASTIKKNVILDTTAGNVQLTLPSTATLTLGQTIYIHQIKANNGTIAANGADDIVDKNGTAGNATYPAVSIGNGGTLKIVYASALTWNVVLEN